MEEKADDKIVVRLPAEGDRPAVKRGLAMPGGRGAGRLKGTRFGLERLDVGEHIDVDVSLSYELRKCAGRYAANNRERGWGYKTARRLDEGGRWVCTLWRTA